MFIEYVEILFKLYGKIIVLILLFCIEFLYFMDKIMFGIVFYILVINLIISIVGFINRSLIGFVVFVWMYKEILVLYCLVGFKLGIIEENFNYRNELFVK